MNELYDRNPRDYFPQVGCMYPLLPWQMDDLTGIELEMMIETVKTMASVPRL